MLKSSSYKSILHSIQKLNEPIHITGFTNSSQAFLLVNLVQEFKNILVICQSDDIAANLLSDIEFFSENLKKKVKLSYYPTWEYSPYSSVRPSFKTRFERLSILNHLVNHDEVNRLSHILVTTLPALSQATLPPDLFKEFSFSISTHENITSRDALIEKFIASGYMRIDPVEDLGTFTVRGEIIDIFPIGSSYPVRIELFDNLVEKIRFFDPKTQRTLSSSQENSSLKRSDLKSITIPPAMEVMLNSTTFSNLKSNIKNFSDENGISKSVRDPLIESIQSGVYPEASEKWAPFAYSKKSSLIDYLLTNKWVCSWIDELSCQQQWDDFISNQNKYYQKLDDSQKIIPPPHVLFTWNSELETHVKNFSKLFLDRIEIAQLESIGQEDPSLENSTEVNSDGLVSSQHRVLVKTNYDLQSKNRHSLENVEPHFKNWLDKKWKVLVIASTESQLERIRFLLHERNLDQSILLEVGYLSQGFRWPIEKYAIITESELLGSSHIRKNQKSAAQDWSGLQALSDLNIGDAIVHVDHGIGRYQGLARLNLSGAPADFLQIEYANKDKLYLPVYRLNVIQKYSGAGEGVTLDRLGSQQFAKTKEKVKESVKKIAFDLVQLYAERKIRQGIVFSHRDAEFQEFEAQFPYDETVDQMKAIDSVLSDFESGRVMDRLICGDVGYGKTEVAMRAAFKAVSHGKQVAVLVPTTILAQQHEQSFRSRMKNYPFIIESVSRYKNLKEQKKTLEALKEGKVDIIIGTHRLLSRDIKFKDLGLIIVDEEHRFGVEHKEKLKTLKVNTHVLTLTATPIPRTLHMALSGLREVSLIHTPPVNRLPIRTYVSKYDEPLIQKAIEFELSRDGQVFYLYNRVDSIHEMAEKIQALVPHSKVLVAHGQMSEGELEKTMLNFYEKRGNILVCTTIIESGLDIPTANTMIIHRADALGLAQLYQIRGRVGRGQQRGYAYLLIPAETTVTEDAKKRLEVIQRFVELGSGFQIASHDLEIRGGGDLLGPQQSGNIAAVGFDLYTEILEEAILEIQGKPPEPEHSMREPEIKAPFASFLSEEYIPDVHQRLSFYRRFSGSKNDEEVILLEEELQDRFGKLPDEAQNLLWLIRIKILLKKMGIDSLTVGPEKISLLPGPQSLLNPARTVALISAYPSRYQLTPDSKLVAKISTPKIKDLFFSLENLFKDFSSS